MIVRDRPSGWRLFLILRGSILKQIRWVLLANILVATAVTCLHGDVFEHKVTLTTTPFTLIGLPLAIFLGFRNTASYDRYWEARKRWGEILLLSRNLARQCLTLIAGPQPVPHGAGQADVRVRMVRRCIAYAYALKHQLRGTPDADDVRRWVEPEEFSGLDGQRCRHAALMLNMGRDLQGAREAGAVDPILTARIDDTLSALMGVATACERIKNTPLPFSYTLLLHRTAYLYCFLLPFGLVDTIGYLTPFVVGIVAYTFFGLDALGDEIEEPFGLQDNDLALDAICQTIEVNLRQALGEPASGLPQTMQPIDYCLM
ncbi:bestrophin family protein [Aquabacterium sp.]|uniref:bestrophin family protein n=1 Tax=Aquabacterium sp. TaxID=1872578 RepID=UPI0035B3D0BA